jgi:hypothetical protein
VTAPRGLLGRHVRTDGTLWFEARCPHGVWTTWVARQVSSRVAEVATVAVPGCECVDMSIWTDADDRADRLRVEGAPHEPHCWWGECWCHGAADSRLPDPPAEYHEAIEREEQDTRQYGT